MESAPVGALFTISVVLSLFNLPSFSVVDIAMYPRQFSIAVVIPRINNLTRNITPGRSAGISRLEPSASPIQRCFCRPAFSMGANGYPKNFEQKNVARMHYFSLFPHSPNFGA